ncbi:MAG: protein kinase [Gemmataceae bacterium]|nr:protein kinase [Gemmataceae bacterium]
MNAQSPNLDDQSPAEVVFFAALERATPAERAAYLDEACAGNEALRRRVEALLAAHPEVGQFLERPVAGAEGVAALGGVDDAATDAVVDLSFLAPPAEPGSLGRLDHYEILEVVGRGGMGVVLRARDTKLLRVVAIKVLAAPLAASGAARRRFVREARAAAAVRDDHVVAIHAVEDQGAAPYLVMEFIHGCTLEALIRRGGPLEVKEILRIGMQVASGLAAAHKQGLIHRDVKPANILLENSVQRVKLTDFGLARAADDASLSQSGLIAGTPLYMAPEQAASAPIDQRADLFSLGSVLYALCTGHAPFRADTPLAVLKRVSLDAPRPVREVNPDIPDWLQTIIDRLHAKDPAGRFQTADEVAELLGRRLGQLQRPDSVWHDSKLPSQQARWERAPQVAAALLLLGVAVLGVSIASWFLQRPDDTGPGEAKAPGGSNGSGQEGPPPQPGQPSTLKKWATWATLSSPLDALQPDLMDIPEYAPAEVLAVLGETPRWRLPERANSHWMAHSNDGQLLAVPCDKDIVVFEAATGTWLRTLTGHTSPAYRPAFSPDGKRLASGSENGGLRVWDVTTAQEVMSLIDTGQPVWDVAYDAEGQRLASSDAAGMIKVWDAQGKQIASFAGHAQGVNQIAFSPDGKRLATASLDGACKIWDPDNWKEIRALSANGKTFAAVAWSRDGKLLAAGDDAQVVVWNADSYEVLHALQTPGKALVAFSADGSTLLTARHDCLKGQQHAFTRWDVKTGTVQATCKQLTFGSIAFYHLSADGRTVYLTHHQPDNPHVQALDAETGLVQFMPSGHLSSVHCIAFSPDGRTLATGSHDHTVRLWDLSEWKAGETQPPSRVMRSHTNAVGSLAFSPDGTLLATASAPGGALLVWDTATLRKVLDLDGHSPEWSLVTFSPDGATLAAGGDGRVNLWDVRTGKRDESPVWNDGRVRLVAFSPDGRLLAAGDTRTIQVIDQMANRRLHTFRGERAFTNLKFSSDGGILAATTAGLRPQLRLWDVATGEEQAARDGPGIGGTGLSFHPGGRLVATTAVLDPNVRLWDVAPSSEEVRTFDLRGNKAFCVDFSPEGRYLAAGLADGTVAIWRLADVPDAVDGGNKAAQPGPRPTRPVELRPSRTLLKHAGGVRSLACSPDGQVLASGGLDRHIFLWDTKTWQTRGPLEGHAHHVAELAFSPDSRRLASVTSGRDVCSIRLWDAATGRPAGIVGGPSLGMWAVTFSPDGKTLACGGFDKELRLFDAATGTKRLAIPNLATTHLRTLSFSADGARIATGGSGPTRLWETATGKEITTTAQLPQDLCPTLLPDGRGLAGWIWKEGRATICDLPSGKVRASWRAHPWLIHGLAMSRDGRFLATIGEEGVARVWSTADQTEVATLRGHRGTIHAAVFAPDGSWLATGGHVDHCVRVWDLPDVCRVR